jgi:hypothetical protein
MKTEVLVSITASVGLAPLEESDNHSDKVIDEESDEDEDHVFIWRSQLLPELVMLACVVQIIRMLDPETKMGEKLKVKVVRPYELQFAECCHCCQCPIHICEKKTPKT